MPPHAESPRHGSSRLLVFIVEWTYAAPDCKRAIREHREFSEHKDEAAEEGSSTVDDEAQSFIADGPTPRAFQTRIANADYGVNVQGTVAGVYGESLEHSPDTRTAPRGTGVFGQGDTAGVIGVSTTPTDVDYPASGPGVMGWSSDNRGGVFASGGTAFAAGAFPPAQLIAQLHLVPAGTDGRPPIAGLAGDFFVTIDPASGLALLWFCQESATATSAALWTQFQAARGLRPSGLRGSVSTFSLPSPNSNPSVVVRGPDNNLWFAESSGIGCITPGGLITEYSLTGGGPLAMAFGGDGNLWWPQGDTIVRYTPGGALVEYDLPIPPSTRPGVFPPPSRPWGIAAGQDGTLWFTEFTGNRLGHITLSGTITEITLPTANCNPCDIALGPYGHMWFTEQNVNKIGRLTPTGEVVEYRVPGPAGAGSKGLAGITAGPDGNMWFVEYQAGMIGRITPTGEISEYPVLSPGALSQYPQSITAGPDANVWFTQPGANRIGRIKPDGTINDYPLEMPGCWPYGIVAGREGNIWFTEQGGNRIGCLLM
jgi:streptogramin lyase